ncbi:MAG: hypothetical protein BWK80_02820 [Desulfobacteraceae bacterium IS3]|nr:MAG: hypothetical protein BWK80_02820 [Desulfobacteraceae bacterium IS3]
MTAEQIKETLYNVAGEVLEKLAFIFSFPEEEREPMDYSDAVIARVSFTGPFKGTLTMAVSAEVIPEIAGNMLGLEDNFDSTKEQQGDALKELINVICGNLLPVIAGKQTVFNVEAPGIIAADEITVSGNAPGPPSVAKLDMDDGQCDLMLYIEN